MCRDHAVWSGRFNRLFVLSQRRSIHAVGLLHKAANTVFATRCLDALGERLSETADGGQGRFRVWDSQHLPARALVT